MEAIENSAVSNQRGSTSLAVIICTDIVDWTTKIYKNQDQTLTLTRRDLGLMEEVCDRFQGRVFDNPGDGLLMYFSSAVDAVACAQEIQREITQRATKLPPSDVLKHRVGIHLGDVAFIGTKPQGLGVNMAARLQAVAKPGGISISQSVYDIVKNRLPLPGIYSEVRQLKGLEEAVLVYQIPPLGTPDQTFKRVFISHRAKEPDILIAQQFYDAMLAAGHEVFLAENSIRLGEGWLQRIETELKQCDYLLLLLSEQSATSEMVTEEVRRAKELRESRPENKPVILPIRLGFPLNSPLNYKLRGYLDKIQQREWRSPADTSTILQEVLHLLAVGQEFPLIETATPPLKAESEKIHPSSEIPLPAAEPELPEGQVEVASAFYVERPPIESRCYQEIKKPGALIRIKAPKQMGKTSLMARILREASNYGYQTVPLSLELADAKVFADLDKFLQWFCASVSRRLRLPNRLKDYWDEIFGSMDNCTAYFEEYLLPEIDTPLVLALDEVDRIFEHSNIAPDFLGLLRAWHEESKNRDIWKKLRLIVVHSTEVYVKMPLNQSPFNVGLPVELVELTSEQVLDLAKRHNLNWTTNEVERLMAMVGGHPYLIRLALYRIVRKEMTLDKLLEEAPTESGLYRDHLRRCLWLVQQNPDLVAAFQELTNAPGSVRLPQVQAFKLHSMGLVCLQGNEVRLRCDLYRQYFGNTVRELGGSDLV